MEQKKKVIYCNIKYTKSLNISRILKNNDLAYLLNHLLGIVSFLESALYIYFITPYTKITTAKVQASGSAKVIPYIALCFALMSIGPPLRISGSSVHIAVRATNSPMPAKNGNNDFPTPCIEFLYINNVATIKYSDKSQYK